MKRLHLAAVSVVAALLATPVILYAHAHLLRSSPADGATLATPPGELSFWFSEKPEPGFSSVKVTDSAGTAVAVGKPSPIASMGFKVAIVGGMHAGRYTIEWRTAASDGHPSTGTLHFSVTAAQPAQSAPVIAPPRPDSPRAAPASNAVVEPASPASFTTAMRWAELVVLLTTIGLIILRLAVIPAAKWPPDLAADVSDRAARMARATLVLFLVATLSRGFAKSTMLNIVTESQLSALVAMVRNTSWGAGWAIGFAGAVVALIALLVPGKRFPTGWIVAAVGIVGACLSESLTGHAGSSHRFALSVATDVAHVLGAGGWLGTLAAVVLCAMPALKRLDQSAEADAGGKLLRAYHSTAAESVTIVVASGLLSSWLRLPTLDALWRTDYGSMLFRKNVFVLIVLGLGLYHWRRLVIPAWASDTRRRFLRTVSIELVFGAVIVALTAILVGLLLN